MVLERGRNGKESMTMITTMILAILLEVWNMLDLYWEALNYFHILAGAELVALNAEQVTPSTLFQFHWRIVNSVFTPVWQLTFAFLIICFTNIDPSTESRPEKINLDIYVPPDERFSPKKLSEFIGNSIRASLHFLIPEAKSLLDKDPHFQSFDEIRGMFSSDKSRKVEGRLTEKLQKLVPEHLFNQITRASKGDPMKFPEPQIIASDAAYNLPFLLLFSLFSSSFWHFKW